MTAHARGLLPGGLAGDNGLRRDYAFRTADGALELALGEVVGQARNTPEAVSAALQASLEQLAGAAPTRERVGALCVADRQYLMRELDRHLGNHGGWFGAGCGSCSATFDFHLDYADLPVRQAGPGFPHATVKLGRRQLRLRIPTGADQIQVLRSPADQRRRRLLQALVEPGPSVRCLDPQALNEAEVALLEAELEAVGPAVVSDVSAKCPECGQDNRVGLNPYAVLGRDTGALLGEVHRIAWYYHWSQAEILALPHTRRQQYLRLIDLSRGMTR